MGTVIGQDPRGNWVQFTADTHTVEADAIPVSSSDGGGVVASGIIASPVTFFDVGLPAGYDNFELSITDLVSSVPDALAFVVSGDNGVTWISDPINADTYWTSGLAIGVLAIASNLPVLTSKILVFPGSDKYLFGMISIGYTYSNLSNQRPPLVGDDGNNQGCGLNGQATIPTILQRINKIRFFPQGNQDFPSTSGRTFTGGKWVLTGTPS